MKIINFKTKKGNIEIVFLLLLFTLLVIMSFCIYILQIQVATYVLPPKQDLFYIVQNAYLSLDSGKLEYNQYDMDEQALKQRVEEILYLNYHYCHLDQISYNQSEKTVDIEISVDIEPIVLKNYIGSLKRKIKDTIKLKTMEVKE